MKEVFKVLHQVLYMGSLASSPYRDVTHGDDRYVKGTAFQNAHLKCHVTEFDSGSVQGTEGQ